MYNDFLDLVFSFHFTLKHQLEGFKALSTIIDCWGAQRALTIQSFLYAPNPSDDKIQRVRLEPERTGWARMYDLVREYDKNRIIDNKEDIDTLLVFVSPILISLQFGL